MMVIHAFYVLYVALSVRTGFVLWCVIKDVYSGRFRVDRVEDVPILLPNM